MTGSFTLEGYQDALKLFDRNTVQKALRRTLKEIAAKCRTLADKMIRQDYNIKKKDLKGRLKLTPVQTTTDGAEIFLVVTGKKIPLIQFQAQQTAVGVSVKISKTGPAKVIPHTFKKTMAFGENVFERIEKAGRRVGRGPVKSISGPSVVDLFNSKKIEEAMGRLVEDEAETIFVRNLEFYLSGAGWNVEDLLVKELE